MQQTTTTVWFPAVQPDPSPVIHSREQALLREIQREFEEEQRSWQQAQIRFLRRCRARDSRISL